ncbi:flavin reductase family protein [Georgenia halophila]|uniref:Flavin reductase family protein n=2 Tax=Georgenia halophila TaxID=620889 RepID=A0ABP8LK99_9MICO
MRALPGTVHAAEFKKFFRNHPAGVAVVTADPGDGPVGLTATSIITISAEPPLLAFSLASESSATPALRRAETVLVHLLSVEDLPTAQRFATSGVDRFAEPTRWSRLETGEPLLDGVGAWLRGRVVNKMDAGGSVVVAVQPLETQVPDAGEAPLVYHNRTWHALGEESRLS